LFGAGGVAGIGRPVLIRRISDRACACVVERGSAAAPRLPRGGLAMGGNACFGLPGQNWGTALNANVISRQNFLAPYGYTDENRALGFAEPAYSNYERYLRPDHPTCDRLYELKVDPAGRLVRPVVRAAKWNMRSVTPHHGDYGRVELFELGLEKQNT
jgi:hypothetical protein